MYIYHIHLCCWTFRTVPHLGYCEYGSNKYGRSSISWCAELHPVKQLDHTAPPLCGLSVWDKDCSVVHADFELPICPKMALNLQ